MVQVWIAALEGEESNRPKLMIQSQYPLCFPMSVMLQPVATTSLVDYRYRFQRRAGV
jgi:hypothetical protein